MNKTILFFIFLILVPAFAYAREVQNSNRGIANAVPGDHIIRSNGQRVVLNQGDINHARRQLGLTTSPNRAQASNNQRTSSATNSFDPLPLVTIVILGGIVLLPILSLFSSSGSYKPAESNKTKRRQISKQYHDIFEDIQFDGTDTNAFRWSKIWIKKWFGKTVKILSNSSLGFIRANFNYFSFETYNFESYIVEILIDSNEAIFVIRSIYFDKSTYQSVSELDTYVNSKFQNMIKEYRDFMQSNCFSTKDDTHENMAQQDMLDFYRNLLGLRLRFTHNELKAAYREAATKYHPDKYNKSESRDRANAETLMKQVNEAHETLKKFAA